MGPSNFHTHSRFCDGSAEPEEYVKRAVELGFHSIGFSSHAPVPFECNWTMQRGIEKNYIEAIRSLQHKYKDIIDVYLGMEVDYFPGLSKSGFQKESGLDYVIGSVHFIKDENTGEYLSVDGPEEEYKTLINNIFDGNAQKFVRQYYSLIRRMSDEVRPTIIGHLDLTKKNNRDRRYFDENAVWYREEVIKTLEIIAKSGCILEVNTGGIARGYIDSAYPSAWIIKEAKRLGIPLIINSDAHSLKHLDSCFEETIPMLRELGFRKTALIKGKVKFEVFK